MIESRNMDDRFKTGGRDMPPGENFYTKTMPEDVRKARKVNKAEVERILNQYLYMPFGELVAQVKDPTRSTIEVLVMSILIQAIKKGDPDRLNFVLDRLVGKVKNNVVLDFENKSFHEQCVDAVEAIEAKHERIE